MIVQQERSLPLPTEASPGCLTGLIVNEETGIPSWDTVPGALAYRIQWMQVEWREHGRTPLGDEPRQRIEWERRRNAVSELDLHRQKYLHCGCRSQHCQRSDSKQCRVLTGIPASVRVVVRSRTTHHSRKHWRLLSTRLLQIRTNCSSGAPCYRNADANSNANSCPGQEEYTDSGFRIPTLTPLRRQLRHLQPPPCPHPRRRPHPRLIPRQSPPQHQSLHSRQPKPPISKSNLQARNRHSCLRQTGKSRRRLQLTRPSQLQRLRPSRHPPTLPRLSPLPRPVLPRQSLPPRYRRPPELKRLRPHLPQRSHPRRRESTHH